MNQYISHSDDLRPRHVWIFLTKFHRYLAGSFTNYLYFLNDRALAELILGKVILIDTDQKTVNSIGGLNDIR